MKVPNSLSYREIKAGKVFLGGDSSSGTNCESVDAILTIAGGCPVISDIQDVFQYPSKACLTTSRCHDVQHLSPIQQDRATTDALGMGTQMAKSLSLPCRSRMVWPTRLSSTCRYMDNFLVTYQLLCYISQERPIYVFRGTMISYIAVINPSTVPTLSSLVTLARRAMWLGVLKTLQMIWKKLLYFFHTSNMWRHWPKEQR